ncbi:MULTISPECIES: hypothetical protein [Enterococcus]|uniref:hypothetical protein n=1 Tax=Enterococcus TaxID=1350 RepID=UPI0010F6E1D3|nr:MULTISPECIES: hypothetical protein [Enterococcus]MBM7712735.1 hypothetical protein [Enterococcus xiangfangensis]
MKWTYLWEGTLDEKLAMAEERWSGKDFLSDVRTTEIPEEFYHYFQSLQQQMQQLLAEDVDDKLEYLREVMDLDAKMAFLVRELASGFPENFEDYLVHEKKFYWHDYILNTSYGENTIIHRLLVLSKNDSDLYF